MEDRQMLASNHQAPAVRRRRERRQEGGGVSSSSCSAPLLHKPPHHPAIKATTIHPRVWEEFQEQCTQELQLPSSVEAHRIALQQTEEWHRRWTLQEEQGHTQPSDVDAWQQITTTTTAAAAIQLREEGAKNPSLHGSSSNENSPRDQWSSTSSSSLEAWNERRKEHGVTATPLLRPMALRVFDDEPSPLLLGESMASPPPSKYERHDQSREEERPESPEYFVEPPSPLTLPSASSSVASPTRQEQQQSDYYNIDTGYESSTSSIASFPSTITPAPCLDLEGAKEKLLEMLAIAGGDVEDRAFQKTLVPLWKHYRELGFDAREPPSSSSSSSSLQVEGMWLSLSKPTFFGNLGQTAEGDPMYTLGRMAFDMFLPTQLVVSLQGNFNPVRVVPDEERQHALENRVPKSLVDEVLMGNHVLRTYNIVSAFTIEPHMAAFPHAPNKNVRRPIKGIMTTYGYVLPDPTVPNRLSIWFVGGKISPNDDPNDEREWRRLFGGNQPKRTLGEKVRVLAANLLMGAEVPKEMNPVDGSFEYTFTKPLGGHGVAYMDVIYLDQSLRVCRGHRGTIFVFARIPDTGACF